MPPHRRTSAVRRPRVAGRHHSYSPPSRSSTSPADDHRPADGNGAVWQSASATEQPARSWLTTPVELMSALVIAVLVGVLAVGLAAFFSGRANQLSESAAASNSALVDVGATAQVAGQVRDAVQRVYSYDYARLDENERAAHEVITGSFAADFDEQFTRVRELAPPQQAVVVATVPDLAVRELGGDRAIIVVFIDQQASRSIEARPLLVAGRLTVTAQRVDGRWKIADVVPF